MQPLYNKQSFCKLIDKQNIFLSKCSSFFEKEIAFVPLQ